MNEQINELLVKKVRAPRHSVRQKLGAIGIKALCEMINKSSVKAVSKELGVLEMTIYKYLELNGARRVVKYVLKDKSGAKK